MSSCTKFGAVTLENEGGEDYTLKVVNRTEEVEVGASNADH